MNPALLLTGVLALLAVFQIALALGAPIGRFSWGGQHRVLPRKYRIGSAVAIAIYALIAVIELDRAGSIDLLPDPVSQVAAWVIFGYLVLSVGMNAISRSRHERFTMTPVNVVLSVLGLLIALG